MLMNHLLLLTNSNVTECMKRSMRSVNRIGHFLYSRRYTLNELKMAFTLNKIKKRNEMNPTKNYLNSNNFCDYHKRCMP